MGLRSEVPNAPASSLTAFLGVRLLAIVAMLFGAAGLSSAELVAGAERAIYATITVAGVATIFFAWWIRYRGASRLFAVFQTTLDIGLVSYLVSLSGGTDSIFIFLFVPVCVYAALAYGRRAAYGATLASVIAYGSVLWAPGVGAVSQAPNGLDQTLRLAMWGGQTVALLLVALLSSALLRQRDRADKALHERTRDLRSLQQLHQRTVESLTSGLLTIDSEDVVTSFNPEAARITGLDGREALGRYLDDVLPGAREVVRELETRPGKHERGQFVFSDQAGTAHHIGLSASALRPEEGRDHGRVVIFQDVTEIVEMQTALRQRERMAAIGELAARLAHEIRNPLAAISGSVETMNGMPADSDDRARLHSIVLRETERLDALITDFLQYARPAPPAAKRIVLKGVIDEIADLLENQGATVIRRVAPDLAVSADEGQVRQILWNLCRNSLEAMSEAAGELRIEARRVREEEVPAQGHPGGGRNDGERGTTIEILLSDTGEGIAPEHLERIFDPFFTTKTHGTGLGLATVHRIVAANGGRLRVESQVGQGTTMRLLLPEAEDALHG